MAEETFSSPNATFTALNGWSANGWRARYAAGESSPVAYQFVYDAQGNLVERQNANTYGYGRAAYDQAVYEGYGALRSDTLLSNSVSGGVATAPHDPSGFGGQWGYYTDVETGLLCLTHRYYDPGAGKFLTRDPIGYAGGANLYGFCDDNPVNRCDPAGLRDFSYTPLAGHAVNHTQRTPMKVAISISNVPHNPNASILNKLKETRDRLKSEDYK